jgi:hypothetical protein
MDTLNEKICLILRVDEKGISIYKLVGNIGI